MTHNQTEINANELLEFIESIDKFLDDKISLYALGGTALTLRQIKISTRDIDINVKTKKEHHIMKNLFQELGFKKISILRWISQEGLAFNLFHGSEILGTHLLPDCLDQAKKIQEFQNIKILTLSLEDIIISKLARGDTRDFEDIKTIFFKKNINKKNLIQRYKETMENSIVQNYKQKLLDLIDIKFKEWNFTIEQQLIEEVKQWEEQ